jgi:hypothetical protein
MHSNSNANTCTYLLMLLAATSLKLLTPTVNAQLLSSHLSHLPAAGGQPLQPHSRQLSSTPSSSAVLESWVLQPGAAAAAAALQQAAVAAQVKELSSQLASFRLRQSDLNIAFVPKQVGGNTVTAYG